MARKNARNSDLLKSAKAKTSPPIYSLLVDLVNEEREDLAEVVLKIDFLLEYVSSCIRQKDFQEAREALTKVEARIELLRKENANIEYLQDLYNGIASKCKMLR